ncbi:dethiobiotin synthase [Paenibacillus sp. N4]|uniref:dethiobiotin synthase n=1 Tax=Paenibacillus vietnamensis TaxID=2590547 RepID=UPI001CD0497C|nr:dethiobiotin synthase [Paenibacillus vietnamensis]MCA0756275.1 dethiobiotin synthase [Paenibacillus vietnamensis]
MQEYRGLFVAGTDTGVGKTVVTAAVAAALRAEGCRAGVWKPVQSGVLIGSGETDAERLLQGTGIGERPEEIASYTFADPLAPALAAKLAGVRLTLDTVVDAGRPLMARYDALLVEGAGGLAVPLTDDAMVVDLIGRLRLPVLLVARPGLGTVNHTLLSVSMLRGRGIPLAGVVLCDGEPPAAGHDPSVVHNAELIGHYGGVKVLGTLPHLRDTSRREELVRAVSETVDLGPIRQAIAGTFGEEHFNE